MLPLSRGCRGAEQRISGSQAGPPAAHRPLPLPLGVPCLGTSLCQRPCPRVSSPLQGSHSGPELLRTQKPSGLVQGYSALLALCPFFTWQVVRSPGAQGGFFSVYSSSLTGKRTHCVRAALLSRPTATPCVLPLCLLPGTRAASAAACRTLEMDRGVLSASFLYLASISLAKENYRTSQPALEKIPRAGGKGGPCDPIPGNRRNGPADALSPWSVQSQTIA